MREYSIKKLIEEYPFVLEFIEQNRLDISSKEELTFEEFLKTLSEEEIEDKAINTDTLAEELYTYIEQMQEFLGLKKTDLISMLSILPGTNKSKEKDKGEKNHIFIRITERHNRHNKNNQGYDSVQYIYFMIGNLSS